MPFVQYVPAPAPSVADRGSANGIATLDSTGKVPSSQIPASVADVLEYDTASFSLWTEWVSGTQYYIGDTVKVTGESVAGYICKVANSSSTISSSEWDEATQFPTTGESNKLYIAKDTNVSYRWTGSNYVTVGSAVSSLYRQFWTSTNEIEIPLSADGKTYMIWTAGTTAGTSGEIMDSTYGSLIYISNGKYMVNHKGTAITATVASNTLTISSTSNIAMAIIEL